MIDNSLGRRPRVQSLSGSHIRGFSIIEVLMSVVLLAIGTVLAIPSYTDMVEKRQVTNGAEQLASFINAAQGAAMKTNREVWISWDRVDGDEWCIGANENSACDCTASNACQVSGMDFVMDNSSAGNRDFLHAINSGGDDNSYAYDPVRGLMRDMDDSLELQLRSRSESFRLNLRVNNTGRVVLCSDNEANAVPGYEVCNDDIIELVEVAQ